MKFLYIVLLIIGFEAQSRELTIVVEPTFNSGQSEDVIKPLSDWLEIKTGHTLKVVNEENYFSYWLNTSIEMPDLTFDPPHVAALRMNLKNYRPLVQTVEDLRFHLVVNQNDYDKFNSVDSLRTETIATMQHPNLASILFEKWFGSSIILPNKILAQYTWNDGINSIFDDSAKATIIPSSTLELYPNLISVKESEAFPGMSILASPHLSVEIQNELEEFFVKLKDQDEAYEVLYELNTKYFIPSKKDVLVGYDELIPRSYSAYAKRYNLKNAGL